MVPSVQLVTVWVNQSINLTEWDLNSRKMISKQANFPPMNATVCALHVVLV